LAGPFEEGIETATKSLGGFELVDVVRFHPTRLRLVPDRFPLRISIHDSSTRMGCRLVPVTGRASLADGLPRSCVDPRPENRQRVRFLAVAEFGAGYR